MVNAIRALLIGIAAAWACVASATVARANPDCTDLIPRATASGSTRSLTLEDLVTLRDIGPVDPTQQYAGLFTVSPDGSRAAFQLRRADPQANGYCLAMLVIDLRRPGRAIIVDRGGDFIRARYDFRGKIGFPTGLADPITPRWSPDGKWIVYRRRDQGAVQLWEARADGSGSRAITASPDDIEDFRITADGRSVIYASRPGIRKAQAEIEREGLSGFHYDDRFAPAASSRPFAPAPIARSVTVLDFASGAMRPASESEAALLEAGAMREGRWTETPDAEGRRAAITTPPGSLYAGRGRLGVMSADHVFACPAAACADASYPWWVAGRIRFLRREGWADSVTAVYEWQPRTSRVRRLYQTEDLLLGCVPDGGSLVCLREGSLQPRRLERLDPASGRRDILFDPNPEFARLTLGRVERLLTRNRFGLESFADLVLPVGYRPGKRYPLVVVQYASRGFLRGGTGDDYPIQGFANRGFAVLSIDKPSAIGLRQSSDYSEIDRINLKDFAERRSILDSVEIAVRLAIARGFADPARIGITGLSDGASTAGFALLHSKMFSAFALSSCCTDTTLPMRVGPGSAPAFYQVGYPRLSDDSAAARAFWREVAFSPNAAQIRAPILAQLSDDEYLNALQSYTALRELDRPIDLYVFPGEHHVKWQPAHRLAVYARAIDWFDFWLNGDSPPGRAKELVHWQTLRAGLARLSAAPPQSGP